MWYAAPHITPALAAIPFVSLPASKVHGGLLRMRILTEFKRRSLAGLGVVATVAVLATLSGAALAQQQPTVAPWPVLQLLNPGPGDFVSSGDLWIAGTAFDPAAIEGSGVSRVDLFLGERDKGGLYLGSAVPGQDILQGLTPQSLAAQRSFQLKVEMPSNISGGMDLRAYAYSAVTGNSTVVSTPIYLNADPSRMPTPVPNPVASVRHVVAGAPGPVFNLSNPSAGDVLSNGDYVVSGVAAPTFTQILFFLDERDTGGTMIGSAIPVNGMYTATVTFPAGASGGHDFVAYAVSPTVEARVSVPIWLGAAPVPTPRPVIPAEPPAE
jgi:hypothetical protein